MYAYTAKLPDPIQTAIEQHTRPYLEHKNNQKQSYLIAFIKQQYMP